MLKIKENDNKMKRTHTESGEKINLRAREHPTYKTTLAPPQHETNNNAGRSYVNVRMRALK